MKNCKISQGISAQKINKNLRIKINSQIQKNNDAWKILKIRRKKEQMQKKDIV
jgi:hypothetical protein